MDCEYRSRSGYCHRCHSFLTCGEERLADMRAANSRSMDSESALARYRALLKIGAGLTAREWSHYDELKREAGQ